MRNWAGNIAYGAGRIHEPRSVEELQELVRDGGRIRALGSRHSFSEVADTSGDLVSLAGLPRRIEVDPSRSSVTVDGAIRYGDLAVPLHADGLALHNLASLPHISVAGACATGTHGSGVKLGSLATAVTSIELIRGDGELITLSRAAHGATFPGTVVALGALGVVTSLTLAVEPTYDVRQDLYQDLDLAMFERHFDALVSAAASVSFFLEWHAGAIDQVWLKSRVGSAADQEPPDTLAGAARATVERHPIGGMDASACTPQLGFPGPWHERLPHFRLDHTPSAGAELQSEYFVAHADAVAAIDALLPLRERIAALILVSEIRAIAADDLWLSPAFERASVAIHFTWKPDWPAVEALLPAIEAALEPFEPRPHWGKLFTLAPETVRSRYRRLPAFGALARDLDPEGRFANDFVDRYLLA